MYVFVKIEAKNQNNELQLLYTHRRVGQSAMVR
jgi:hypothetical protein